MNAQYGGRADRDRDHEQESTEPGKNPHNRLESLTAAMVEPATSG
jgi:hypothetical protein